MQRFSPEEEEYIWTRSRFRGEDEKDGAAREAWLAGLYDFMDALEAQPRDALFNPDEEAGMLGCVFRPVFRAVVHQTEGCPGREAFCDHAFSGWCAGFILDARSRWMPSIIPVLEKLAGPVPFTDGAYRAWMEEKVLPLCDGGGLYHALALEYPVFARQIVRFCSDHAAHIRALIRDAATFGNTEEARRFGVYAARITAVSPPGSDRHQGGRTVHILTFENGGKLVYKPHSTAIDRAFDTWVNFISRSAGYGHFPFPRSVDFHGGSFSEYVCHQPLQSRAQAEDFFRHAGLLFGAVYLLRGNDMHFENILSNGAYPIAVDMETVLQPEDSLLQPSRSENRRFHVTDMLFLPTMSAPPGFTCSPNDSLTSMHIGQHNLPFFEDAVFSGRDYAGQICAGFAAAVEAASSDDRVQLAVMKDCFPGCEVRMVLRPTSTYARFILALARRECLQDGAVYEQILSKLDGLNSSLDESGRATVLKREKQALRILDTPYFSERMSLSSLRSLPEWIAGRRAALDTDLKQIRWCLERHCASDGSETPMPEGESIAPGNVRHLASRILHSLAGDLIFVYACREGGEYRTGETIRNLLPFLDGGMGTVIALAACAKVLPEEVPPARLREIMQELYKPASAAAGVSSAALGLADGAGGFLLGSVMLYEMGELDDATLAAVVGGIEKMAGQELKLRYAPPDVLYGAGGLCAAIDRVPAAFQTEKLLRVRSILAQNVRRALHRDETFDIRLYASAELTGRAGEDPHLVCNHTLRFGNAGKLYNDSLKMHFSAEEREALKELLSGAKSVLPMGGLPEGMMEAGLLSGLPGLLYSLCRAASPEKIPILL